MATGNVNESTFRCADCSNIVRIIGAQAAGDCPRCGGALRYVTTSTIHSQADGRARLSDVGVRSGTGLHCPHCGGAQFKVKRSGKWKAGLAGGVALTALSAGAFAPVLIASAATAKAKLVVCITCGSDYLRN